MTTLLRMRPELEEAALERSRRRLSSFAWIACAVVCIALGRSYSINPDPTVDEIVPTLAVLPAILLFVVWRVKVASSKSVRTRFTSYTLEVSDEGIRRSFAGYRDLVMAWPDVRHVEDRGERGLCLSSRTGTNRIMLYAELEQYQWAKAFALERTPAPVPAISSWQVAQRVLMPVLFFAATVSSMVSESREVALVSLVFGFIYCGYMYVLLRDIKVPDRRLWTVLLLLMVPLVGLLARFIALNK